MQDREKQLAEAILTRDAAGERKLRCDNARQFARWEHAEALRAVEAAAAGLADFQKGLEELHRRASEHRIVLRRIAEAQQCLPEEDITTDTLHNALSTAEGRYDGGLREHVRLENALKTVEQRTKDFNEASAALQAIVEVSVPPDDAFDRARVALSDLRTLDARAARRETLVAEISEARRLAADQQSARDLARRLGPPDVPLASSHQCARRWRLWTLILTPQRFNWQRSESELTSDHSAS